MFSFFTAVARILSVCMLTVLASLAAAQQSYPNKPIRLISPYAPGSTTSTVTRLVGAKLAERLGQSVIVDNRPGGGTIIGTEALVKSPPDGYTILLTASTLVIVPQLIPTSYDPIKDFAPIATIGRTEFVLVLHPSVPANNLKEFITLAKSKPGLLNYSTSGSGTSTHLLTESFSNMVGVKMQHIPYKGSGPGVIDLISGQVQVSVQAPMIVIPHIKSGKLKAIATTGETRLSSLPLIPTFAEAGLPEFEAKSWNGILAPAGTPKEIIDKLSAEIAKIMAVPAFREELISQGMHPLMSTPEQFAALIRADTARFAKIIKVSNIKLEN